MANTPYRRAFRIGLAAGMVLLCCVCGWWSARLAMAPSSDDAVYLFRQWQAQTEVPTRRPEQLDRALALNPRSSEAWIARGLEAEAAGDRETAEVSLRRAAGVDLTYIPRWTLANFYLRSGDMPQFWTWARRAAEMGPDPAALFQLCWRVSGDAREILDRAIPPGPAVRRAYLSFLVGTSRLEAGQPLADELSRRPDAADVDLLLRHCDLALARRKAGSALRVWNGLAARGLVPHREGGVTNGDFVAAPLGRGFDWRPATVEGALLFFDPAARQMLVTLSGKQPESFALVEQYVPVEPGARYEFHFGYRTRALKGASGLSWNFVDVRTGVELAAGAISASADGFAEQTLRFSTPPGCDLARLALRYRRPAGSVRAEGGVVFNRFTITPSVNAGTVSPAKSVPALTLGVM